MFARWLTLFDEAAHEQFAPAVAEQFTTVARRIAASLEHALFATPGLPGAPPGVVGHAG
jgi:hemoglobin